MSGDEGHVGTDSLLREAPFLEHGIFSPMLRTTYLPFRGTSSTAGESVCSRAETVAA